MDEEECTWSLARISAGLGPGGGSGVKSLAGFGALARRRRVRFGEECGLDRAGVGVPA